MSAPVLDLEAVAVRFLAVPLHLLPDAQQRAPCLFCDFVSPAPTCGVMRDRVSALGLPDCAGGYIYRQARGD